MNRTLPKSVCLLCSGVEARVVDQLSADEILRLWQALGVSLSAAAQESFQQSDRINLYQCEECGFQYFSPVLPGNAAFYEDLQRQITTYYGAERFEFAPAVYFAKEAGLKSVLDVGCGSGFFLDQARKAGLQTSGVELSPMAAQACRQKGHQVFSSLLHELAGEKEIERFDFVTAFQVLEHVANPMQFFREAKQLVKPGGYIAMAVPYRDGVFRLTPLDPHQWPPHHLTRWRMKDLKSLGENNGCEMVASATDRLFGGGFAVLWNQENRLATALGQRPYWGGRILPAVISFLYRKSGCKFLFPRWGQSIYAIYKVPNNIEP